jgi:hypothetical protein
VRPLPRHAFRPLVGANQMILSSVMVRRAVLDTVGGFDEALPVMGCEDWDLWLRIARATAVICVPEELVRYRVHADNTARTALLASGLAVLEKLFTDPDAARAAGRTRRAARAALHWYHAGAAAPVHRGDAWRLVSRALTDDPRSLLSRPALGALARIVAPRLATRLLG